MVISHTVNAKKDKLNKKKLEKKLFTLFVEILIAVGNGTMRISKFVIVFLSYGKVISEISQQPIFQKFSKTLDFAGHSMVLQDNCQI